MPLRWREGTPDPAYSWSFRDRIDQWRLTATAAGEDAPSQDDVPELQQTLR